MSMIILMDMKIYVNRVPGFMDSSSITFPIQVICIPILHLVINTFCTQYTIRIIKSLLRMAMETW